MVTDGSYICDQHRVMYRLAESLCCTPETDVILCVNCTSKKKKSAVFKIYTQQNGQEEGLGKKYVLNKRFYLEHSVDTFNRKYRSVVQQKDQIQKVKKGIRVITIYGVVELIGKERITKTKHR